MPQSIRSIAPIENTEVEPLDGTIEAVAEEAVQPDALPVPFVALRHIPLDLLLYLDELYGLFVAKGDEGYGHIQVEMAKGRRRKVSYEFSKLFA